MSNEKKKRKRKKESGAFALRSDSVVKDKREERKMTKGATKHRDIRERRKKRMKYGISNANAMPSPMPPNQSRKRKKSTFSAIQRIPLYGRGRVWPLH